MILVTKALDSLFIKVSMHRNIWGPYFFMDSKSTLISFAVILI